MSEDKENVPETESAVSPEDLVRMGIDEDGIFNFLHDAIGPDVGTEVLREFSNSDHFAELLDVVTNSLSVRQSGEPELVVEGCDDNSAPDRSNSSASEDARELVDQSRRDSSSSSGSSVKMCDTGQNHSDSQSEEPIIAKESESIDDLAACPENTEIEQSEKRKSYSGCRSSSTKPTSDFEVIEQSLQLKEANVNDIGDEISKSRNESEQLESEKGKFRPVFDKEFPKYQSQHSLKHCSIILCDVIGLGSDYIDLAVQDPDNASINIAKETIKETLRKEKLMRLSYAVKLSKRLDSNILQLKKDRSENRNDVLKDQEVKNKSERKNKSRREIESGSDSSSSSSDIQFVKRKSDPNIKKKEEGEQSKSKAEYSAGGTRILPFERKKIPEENRPRKFDKFERMFKEKSKGVKKEKPVIKIEPAVPEKTFASSSFRIPKKKDGQRHRPEKKVTALTPLASQHIPSENLNFERFRKTKNEDRHSKADPYQNKDTGRDREAFINEPIKIEIELADEPDSFADDDGTASQTAPLSEVKVGHLVLSVATFLRDNPSVELPLADDASTISELLVVKIAWWFRTLENDPPPDEICFPELIDKNPPPIPVCDEDDGSDISFLGHVSNPGDETEECQINEVSSSSYRYEAEDSGKSEEFCGSALLNAKIRTAGENFQNIFDLRNGASYDKENFQAKCNLCNELIVGKTNLSLHLKKQEHKENFLNTSLKMAKPDEKSEVKMKVTETKIDKSDNKEKDSKTKEKEREKDKVKSVVIKATDQNGKTDGDKALKATTKTRPAKQEMERTKTSTGLPIKVPIMPGTNRKRSRSKSRTRSPRRRKSKSPKGKSRSPSRRSPIQLVVRSPQRHSQPRHSPSRYSPPRHRHKRRSRSPRKRSRSPRHLPANRRSRSPNRRRSSSLERVEEFLARTNRGRRSRSPSSISKRQRRSRSRSPKPFVKPDNKEFHEKLALTVDGKWTADMESQWNLMEGEQNMYLKQFQERQKQLQDKPEDHPRYADEWTEFWEKRYQEVEKAGKDPDTYNYVDEWKEFWLKRVIFLLQAEADMKIKEIKKKYGMDYESLRKIRFTPVAEIPKVEVDSFLPIVNRVIVPSNVLNFPPPLSVSDRGSDDQMSRAMSISEDGRSDHSKAKAVPAKKASPKKSNVTVDDIKSTWESLTGQKMGSAKSDAGSSSVASYDFDGFDLVQVLRLMCQIDQTLGIYAQQVQEFFKTAEELEISKRNKSYSLLNKKDFVELLFKCRDKFMNVIRANVVARDVLKSINLTVYALNAILDSPQCQKFKPALDATLAMELEQPIIPEPIPVTGQVKAEPHVVPPQVSPPVRQAVTDNGRSSSTAIAYAVAHLSLSQKEEIAGLIAKTLVSDGKECISDSALMKHLMRIFAPIIANIPGPSASAESYPATQEIHRNRNVEGVRDSSVHPFHSVSGTRRNEEAHAPNVSVHRPALPPLPTFGTRAASPPPSVPNPLQNATNPFASSGNNSRVSSQYHPYGGSRGGFAGRGRPTSPVSSGRRSPFSRRGYAGNPAPEDKEPDEEDSAFLYDRERPSSEINLNLNEAVSKLSNELLATKEGWSGIFSPPTSVSVSSEDLSLDEVPNSVKLPPGILNLIRKEQSTEGNTSSSRYTSTSRTKTRDLSQGRERERHRERRQKRERRSRRSPNSPSPSERKENAREERRYRHSREKSRRHSIEENREKSRRHSIEENREKSRRNSGEGRGRDDKERRRRREERHRRARQSESSSRSSIIRLPLQGPSQGVNSSMYQRSPPETEERQSKERPSATPFNYGCERMDVDSNVHNATRKYEPGKLTKPSRGVSAIFWETSSVSGGEGKCDAEAAEDAFSKDKIKARHYRKDKVDLEPGEIISSSTDFSDAESIINSCDPRIKKHKHIKPKKHISAKSKSNKEKEVINSAIVDSQDSFNDFDECMTKENIVPVVDLDTSFEDRELDPRKVKLDMPIAFPLVEENIIDLSQDKISDGSLTDYESPSSPTKTPKKISMLEPVTPDSVQNTISCEIKANKESQKKNGSKLGTIDHSPSPQSNDKFPLGSEILSDGELSNVTGEQNFEKGTSSIFNSSSKLERVDSPEDDVLSKVSTESSGKMRQHKTALHENPNHTDISSDSALGNDPVVIDFTHSSNDDTQRFGESQKKELSVPVVCDEGLPVEEKTQTCSNAAVMDAAGDNLQSTNEDSMEEEPESMNETQGFIISISTNIFESADASSEDEVEESSEIFKKIPMDTVTTTSCCSNGDKDDIIENAHYKSTESLINDPLLLITDIPATPQPITSSHTTNTCSNNNVNEDTLMEDLNVAAVVNIEFSSETDIEIPHRSETDVNCPQNLANNDDSDDPIESQVETKVLIEKEVGHLVIVQLDSINVTDTVEVTEEFLQ